MDFTISLNLALSNINLKNKHTKTHASIKGIKPGMKHKLYSKLHIQAQAQCILTKLLNKLILHKSKHLLTHNRLSYQLGEN